MTKKKSTKELIPFYEFDKQIAYFPRKKGEKIVFKESFTFEGVVNWVKIDFTKKRLVVQAPTLYVSTQIMYIDQIDVSDVMYNCLMNDGRMHGEWEVYRDGRKILLRYNNQPLSA